MQDECKFANHLVNCAFSRQHDEIDIEHGTNDGTHININLETIIDVLMHNVGRFCEAHLNDFMISWESVKAALNNTAPGNDTIAFAIRQYGVDSNMFLYSRVKDHKHYPGWTENYYRKIYAIKIQRELKSHIYGSTPDDIMEITVTLKEITNCIQYSDIERLQNKKV